MNLDEMLDKVMAALSQPELGGEAVVASKAPSTDPADRQANDIVNAYLRETKGRWYGVDVRTLAAGRMALEAEPEVQVALVKALYLGHSDRSELQTRPLLTALLARKHAFTTADLERLLEGARRRAGSWDRMLPSLLRHLRRHVDGGSELTPAMRRSLEELRRVIQGGYEDADTRKEVAAINEALGETDATAQPEAGESWSDLALDDLSGLSADQRTAWGQLFAHAQTAHGSKPARAWSQTAARLLAPLHHAFDRHIERWFSAVSSPRMVTREHVYQNHTYTTLEAQCSDRNIGLLKGLAWYCAGRAEPATIRALARMAEGALKKIPGTGPWAVRAASAAVWALGETNSTESVAALSRLRLKVTHRGTLTHIEKAIDALAKRQGISRDELEDLSVPTFGMGTSGVRREAFGDCAADMRLDAGGSITVAWFGPGGKPLKSVPAAVRKEHAAELKALKADADAAQKTLTAQRQRIESGLLTSRTWTLAELRERYFEHPLLGHIARRLLWRFGAGDETTVGIWDAGKGAFVGVDGAEIGGLRDDTPVQLWHPIRASVEQIEAWRGFLESREIRQPFKQAHREVYLLTDAEMRTRTYSNRYAGHLLKQHQFNQLAAQRGWKNKLRLMVDDEYPPAQLLLPEHGLRAEFWVEGAGDQVNDTGTYLYLSTDQVRFYPIGAGANSAHAGGGGYYSIGQAPPEPLSLDTIPPLVFSEVMRDVDLFVGVASVGNDPAWSDGGPGGRHVDYWHDYAFGELSATAQTRAAVLARLLPRLKIASRCTLEGRFLKVRGDLRTYKIHLGSGNILMEPNDQYLCIVQAPAMKQELFLPFEGDNRLSVILSKAFLLAEDTRITDLTITRQLAR